MGMDFVSCPTAASVDGFCSSVAAMTWNGCKKTLTAVAPKIVVADLDIIKKAPIRLAKSGFGDMIGKYIALTDWKIGQILKNEFYCQRIAAMTLEATKTVMDSAQGILSGEETAYENLMSGLLLSGLAMQMMGNSRPASGAEHHISHIIEMEPEGLQVHSDALHGEKVGVGTLLVLEEYKRIATYSGAFRDYQTFSESEIFSLFGEKATADIQKENENDAAADITGAILNAHWQEICNELHQLPDPETLKNLYRLLGVKATLPEIQVPEEKAPQLLSFAPMVRNRLTLLRIHKCLQ